MQWRAGMCMLEQPEICSHDPSEVRERTRVEGRVRTLGLVWAGMLEEG
jgi:hypothetical protein